MPEQDKKEQTSVLCIGGRFCHDSTVAMECLTEMESAGEDQHYRIGGGDALEQPEYIKE
jgi:hypothetical protein